MLARKWACEADEQFKLRKTDGNVEIGMRTLVSGVRIPFAGVFQCARLAEHVSLI